MDLQRAKRIANAYRAVVALLGAAILAMSIYRVVVDRIGYQWAILLYLTVLTGAFTVRIGRLNSKFSVSDVFVYINMTLFGTAAGVLTAALDGLLASARFDTLSRRQRAAPFNTAVLALSVQAAGAVFFTAFGRGPLSEGGASTAVDLAVPLLLSALAYYVANSVLVATMVALERGEDPLRVWHEGLGATLGVTLAGTSAGALIAHGIRSVTPLMLLAVAPVLVTAYALNKLYLGADDGPICDRPAYRRFHYFMVALGLGFIALLLHDVLRDRIGVQWLVGASLAVLAAFLSVPIPGVKIKLTLADTFVFANTMLFGPLAGGITAALDGFAGSLSCATKQRRLEFALFNMGGMALAAYAAGELFFRVLGHRPLFGGPSLSPAEAFLPAVVLAIAYYLLNSIGVAVIVALQQQAAVFRFWRENLMWGLTTCVACALGALLVAAGVLAVEITTALAALLVLAATYLTCRAFASKVPQQAPPA